MARPLQAFLRLEASSGLVLLAATLVALVWANTATGSYVDLWSTEVTLTVGDWSLEEDLLHVVNDGLMTLFFLVIGLEVKRELTVGELRTRRAAMLPLAAAAGGMVLPAAIYLAGLGGDPGTSGWGVPIATDVAFALGA
ncbi:MAG: Na+/H+ antiporter NhaA, partial [Miltoncostaeaceae bacterium]